jgi:outer membrane protein assembly factor BamA
VGRLTGRTRAALERLVGGVLVLAASAALADDVAPPSFADLEAGGWRYGTITVRTENVFDTSDPAEDLLLFRWANALHIVTRREVVERALLFRNGEVVSAHRVEETERVLRGTRYLSDARIRPVAVRDGVVDVEVVTRDAWTLDPGISASRAGGANAGGISLQEANLLGTGWSVGIGRSANVDRTATELTVQNDRAFGSWTGVGLSLSSNSDGERQAFRVVRPFYALDARWAAGVSVSRDDRIEAVYVAGEVASRYRRQQDLGEVFAGFSEGVRDGWVNRWSFGVAAVDSAYSTVPGEVAPPFLSPDETYVWPFLRLEVIEDRFERTANLSQVGRTEFLALGVSTRLQLGYAARSFGSTRDAVMYTAAATRGVEFAPRHVLVASGGVNGQLVDGAISRQRANAQLQWFVPQSNAWLFYASLSGDMLTDPAPLDVLTLGGDNGVRGYPLRYQSGTRRMVLSLEERLYTDQYWFRLLRLGAAAFVDVGRAWGGPFDNPVAPGWLADVGIGLRFFNVRAAFATVIHLDLAMPVDPAPGVKKLQVLVRTRASF